MSSECVLRNFAVEVMFDGVLGSVPASQQAAVSCPVASLVSPVCAPSVPKCAECCGTYSRRSELF